MFHRYLLFIFLYGITFFPITLHAQDNVGTPSKQKENLSHENLFDGSDIFHFKLAGKLNNLFNDRSDNSSYHPMLLQYMEKDSNLVSIQLMVKTRGHFRRIKGNCKMPPLLLEFPKEQHRRSVFKKQHKLKLVVPCQGDEYVIREWLVYKIYNLISEKSFKAKLVQVDFEDSLKQRKTETHYCILLEDEKQMAERNQSFVWKKKMLTMQSTNPLEFNKMAVFQYMIGNTDWGVPYLQNIVLITKDSLKTPIAVPYDFDHAGIVNASYAGPAPELEIESDLIRLYRGYCESDLNNFAETFELFNHLKSDIYNVYTGCPLLTPKYIKFVKRFLDDFYSTINDKRAIESEFGKPCRTNIRVEIKGLKN